MTSFLFTAVAVSGLKIISSTPFTRRDRFVLTCSLLPGFGSILVPNWFDYVFTYSGNNHALSGFYNAIVLVMETGFAVTGFIGVVLNLIIPQEADDVDSPDQFVEEEIIAEDGEEGSSSSVGYEKKSATKVDA
ncbi:unnamed protein product [[Candida] boidinii]|nr:unnamed protein product [[Candida] boidinii]